ncbi:hypothetical protein [Yeguia hominis]|uniref:nucleotide-binding protein n=1 Tax=Yeguia hominis TaxID=2763662 RepID=UPI0020161C91|nr:hypothetical protein [Yeguia hominis]
MICGHYGCGKTNLALNLALDAAKSGKKVTLVDLDLINPYFRSSEYGELLAQHGVELIAPLYANTNLDLPVISPRIASVFESGNTVIFDVGGDDAGAAVLGSFSKKLHAVDYEMLYVINRYRVLSTEPAEAESLLREIETSSRLKATGIVNNSHLKGETTAQTIRDSLSYAAQTEKRLALPLRFTTAPRACAAELADIPNLYPVTIYVRSPWE